MRRKMISLLIVTVLLLPAIAGAVSEKDFEAQTTKDIINLCTASPDDPLYQQAINFCHGYLSGAYHYYEASTSGKEGFKLICMPDPQPSRNESIAMFIDWAKAHPQYKGEPAVETEFRFLMEKWPCKR
jgi:hypothetical protein